MEPSTVVTKQILESHNSELVAVVKHCVPEAKLAMMDPCVLTYLIRMLEGQLTPESCVDDTVIVESLSSYFFEFEMYPSSTGATDVAQRVVKLMEEKKLTQRVSEEAKKLETPMSIGRHYEDTVRRTNMFGGQKVVVNTNDEWTWNAKRDAAKNDRKRRKEDEKKSLLQGEYEEYLKKRGLAVNATIMKVHNRGDKSYSTDIRVPGINMAMGKQTLYTDAELNLMSGHRYGFIGKNGAGKTTLLRALSEGDLHGISPFIQILHVEQEISSTADTPIQIILDADVERSNLLREEQELLKSESSSARLAEVYERLDAIDAHSAEARAAAILHGLSFTQEMMSNPSKMLSGGWRMRVALARALFVEPDILLLDEPTNHLDLHAVLWLEQFLQSWPKTLVVVSHSRSFLNSVCTEVIALDQCQLHYYKGNYDQYEQTRVEQLKQQQRKFEAQERDRSHMQSFVDKFRCSAARAKMAQSRIKALERMELVAPVMIEQGFSFSFPVPDEAPSPFLQIVDCEFGYKAGSSLFTDVNFSLDVDSRVALVGPNGAGKSTFLKMCLNQLEPRNGQVIRNQKIRVAHFAQHHLDLLTPQQSAIEFMRTKFPNVEDGPLRAHLGGFGLSAEKALQPIYTLSGGQKSRLAFSWITYTKPHLLMLDEPTNHLDIDTVDALLRALLEFKGGLLVVSHDEHFISSLCDQIFVCGKGRLDRYDGDFEQYKKTIAAKLVK